MSGLIVITGLEQLAPSERWERLIEPLASKLEESGLGELPDLSELARELHTSGRVEAREVAIRLRNFDYGMELVERVLKTAGLECVRRRPERLGRAFGSPTQSTPLASNLSSTCGPTLSCPSTFT